MRASLAGLVLLMSAFTAILVFYVSTGRTFAAYRQDFMLQRQAAVQAAIAVAAGEVTTVTVDWATWNDMYRYVEEPDPVWEAENLAWLYEDLGFSSVVVLNLAGDVVYQGGRIADWTADLRANTLARLLSDLSENPEALALVYEETDNALYWVAAAHIVGSYGGGSADDHNGYLIIADRLAAEDTAAIEAMVGVRHLRFGIYPEHVEIRVTDADSLSEAPGRMRETAPAPADVGSTSQSTWLSDEYALTDYIGSPGVHVHYHNQLPIAEAQLARWGRIFAASVLVLVSAILGMLYVGVSVFVRPFARLSDTMSHYSRTGQWLPMKPTYSEYESYSSTLIDTIEELSDAKERLREAHDELEERVAERTAELAESEQRYRGVVEDLPVLICRFDVDRRITFVNESYCRYFNKREDELLGIDFLDLIPLEDRDVARSSLATLAPDNPIAAYDHRVYAGDGTTRWQRWADRALFNSDGSVRGYQSIGEDITEQRHLEEQLLQAQKLETVGRLAGGVAHDFNNILTAIVAHATFAMESSLSGTDATEDLRELLRSADRARDLTKQLLTFSRSQVIVPKVVRINELLADLRKMLNRLIGEDIALQMVLDQEVGAMRADPVQLQQLVVNLVVNARDALPDGGEITIETSVVSVEKEHRVHGADIAPGEYVLLSVTDNGCGMTEEVKARLFEPFFTTKELGRGTGLGLPTVYGVVKQHKGHVWAESELGQGTSFRIYLPLAKGTDRAEPARVASAPGGRGHEVILLADDDASVRAAMVRMLKRLGYQVIDAEDGDAALALSEQHTGPLHLLITDVVMPRMGGKQLAEKLLQTNPQLKVLFASGYTDSQIDQYEDLGQGVSFLPKPFTEPDLSRKVREMLDGNGHEKADVVPRAEQPAQA